MLHSLATTHPLNRLLRRVINSTPFLQHSLPIIKRMRRKIKHTFLRLQFHQVFRPRLPVSLLNSALDSQIMLPILCHSNYNSSKRHSSLSCSSHSHRLLHNQIHTLLLLTNTQIVSVSEKEPMMRDAMMDINV